MSERYWTAADSKRARELLAAASPRPWLYSVERDCVDTGQTAGDGQIYDSYSISAVELDNDDDPALDLWHRDAPLIAAAPDLLARAVDEIERLQGWLDMYSGKVKP